jgi:hypothetical protein
MNMPTIDGVISTRALAGPGFAFLPAPRMRLLLERAGSLLDWADFAASWNDLGLDTYMADGGRYRRRRHAVYRAEADGAIVRQPHQPHYQGRDYNHLNGGIDRWFAPVAPEIGACSSLSAILTLCRDCFGALSPAARAWHVEVHQFRIEASGGSAGKPTPEGMHRDGVDYVLVMLVDRVNIQSGVTTIANLDKCPLGSFTLIRPFDAAWVDDARVYHGVTPVEPLDATKPAHRDALVITFRKAR